MRPETGPLAFEGDFTGLFIRGDNAAAFGFALADAIEALREKEDGLHGRTLTYLLRLLQATDDCGPGERPMPVQLLKPISACLR